MSEPKSDPTADPELEEILDSALQDMTKKPEESSAAKPAATESTNTDPAVPDMFSEDFIREAAAQFETNMAAILGSFSGIPEDQITQEQIAQTFSKMAEAAAQVMAPAAAAQPTNGGQSAISENQNPQENINDVTAAIAQTLQSLNTNSENLQTPFTDEDLANMFNNFNLDGQQENGNNMFLPFMQGMMQSLLSKEVLYPSLKELLDKYPDWLKANEGKIEAAEFERYKQQQELMTRVCTELEGESEQDSEDVRRQRFETVLKLMQDMQNLGQPPIELVGDIGLPTQGFAPPVMPSAQDQQCSIM